MRRKKGKVVKGGKRKMWGGGSGTSTGREWNITGFRKNAVEVPSKKVGKGE